MASNQKQTPAAEDLVHGEPRKMPVFLKGFP